MKTIQNFINESTYNGDWNILQNNIVDPDYITIEPNNHTIAFHKQTDVKGDYFGDATKEVLKLKPMTSFEDSEVIYIKLK